MSKSGQHSGAAGCVTTSQLQCPSVDPVLRLLPLWRFAWVLWFSPTSEKHAGRWTGYSKSPWHELVCKFVCVVTCDELVPNLGCVLTEHKCSR